MSWGTILLEFSCILLLVGKNCSMCQTQPYDSLFLLFVVKRILELLIITWKLFENDCKCLEIKCILCSGYKPLPLMVDPGRITNVLCKFMYWSIIDRFCLKCDIVKVSLIGFQLNLVEKFCHYFSGKEKYMNSIPAPMNIVKCDRVTFCFASVLWPLWIWVVLCKICEISIL